MQPNNFVEKWDENLNPIDTEKHSKRCGLQSAVRCNREREGQSFGGIFLVRNPWDAFFSEFQRTRIVRNRNGTINGHVHNLMVSDLESRPQYKRGGVFVLYARNWVRTLTLYELFKAQNRDS